MIESSFIMSWGDFLASHLREWESLFKELAAPPDLNPDWCRVLIAVHNVLSDDISVLAVKDAHGLAMVFPYRRRRAALTELGAIVLEPVINIHCIRNAILSRLSISEMQEVLRNFLNEEWQWDVFSINNIDFGGDLANIWESIEKRNGFRTQTIAGESPPFLTIDCSWNDFAATKSSNFRYNLRRKRRKLESRGEVGIEFITTPNDFSKHFEEICDIERRSWKETEGSAITSRAWETGFYREILPKLLSGDQLVITLLRLSGQAIAHDISAIVGTKAFCLKTSFDQEYASESPGTVLRTDLLEHLFSNGLVEYDFLGAGESYKLGWSSGIRTTFHATVYNSTWRGTISAVRSILKSKLDNHKTTTGS